MSRSTYRNPSRLASSIPISGPPDPVSWAIVTMAIGLPPARVMPGSVLFHQLEVFRRCPTVGAALWRVVPGLNVTAAQAATD